MAPHLKSKKSPKLEFRSEDEAWYDVSLQLKGTAVKIHYAGFSRGSDELFRPEDFKSVEDLRSRFRFSSEQMQDQQCGRVVEGMTICVSCSTDGEDIRFFDAVVEQIYRSNHRVVDGEDECRCAFVVLWLAGPHANERTTVYCENICLLTPGIIETHPVINALVKLLEEKADFRTPSVGKNPSRKSVATLRDRLRVPGIFSTNFESKQQESGKTTMEAENTCDLNKCRKLNEQDRAFNTIEETFTNANEEGDQSFATKADCTPHYSGSISSQLKEKQEKSDGVNATEKNLIDEPLLINVNKGVEESHGPKADCTSCLRSISSQSEERQKKSDEADFTEGILIGREAPVQELFAHDIECEYLVKGVSDIGSDTNMSSHLHRDTDLYLPKQDDDHGKMTQCGGDQSGSSTCSETNSLMRNRCEPPVLPDLNSIPVDNYGVIGNEISCYGGFLESEGYNNPSKEDSGHQVVQSGMACRSSYLIVDGDISIQNEGHRKVFLASSWGKGKRQKNKSNEMFINNERLVQGNGQNDECVQAWEKLASPGNDYDGIDALRPNGSTTPLLESHKRKKPFDSSAYFCELPDKIIKKEDKSLNPGEVDTFQSSCLAASRLESHKRQELANIPTNLCDLPEQIISNVDEIDKARCDHEQLTKRVSSIEMQSQEVMAEAVVISSDSENDHNVQENVSMGKRCYDTKDLRRQQKTFDARLQDGLSATVEQSGKHSVDLFELDRSKNAQLNCCGAYRVHGKECGVCAVHSPKDFSSSASAEGDSNINGEKDELCEVGNCKHSSEFMKPREWSKRANERIQKVIVDDDRYNCTKQGVGDIYLETEYGRGNEDVRADESQFSSSQVLMLDNLEKDVYSSDVLDAISHLTDGAMRVNIIPSRLKYERFTRGYVFFRDRASLRRAATFLQDDNFLIVSSKGRPWVVDHEVDGVMEGTSEGFAIGRKGMLPSWMSSSGKILIVHNGTREYEKAKRRKKLFIEFREHVTLLHQRLERYTSASKI